MKGKAVSTAIVDPYDPALDWLNTLAGNPRTFFDQRLLRMQGDVATALGDGLPQLVPLILSLQDDVPRLRQRLGRAVWRRVHHASIETNFMRSLVWLRFEGVAGWDQIVNLPEHHLRSCRNAIDWPTGLYAAHAAAPGKFSQIAMLYRDTVKMGGAPKLTWSLQRLKREHDRLSVRSAIAGASQERWASPFLFSCGDYEFVRLTSDRDFVREGKLQRHCIATFRADARAGKCVVMQCSGPERATFLFGTDSDYELSGFANTPVSEACLAAARSAQAAFQRTTT